MKVGNSLSKGVTFALTIGKYDGFYISLSTTVKRICLGWIAFDFHPHDLDFVLGEWAILKKEWLEKERAKENI